MQGGFLPVSLPAEHRNGTARRNVENPSEDAEIECERGFRGAVSAKNLKI
jgi:hypothetical protein